MRQFIILTGTIKEQTVSIPIDNIDSIMEMDDETRIYLSSNPKEWYSVNESATEITKRINQIQKIYETEDI